MDNRLRPEGRDVWRGDGRQSVVNAPSNPLSDKFVVLGMTADPEPRYAALDINADGAIVEADARRPVLADVF